MVVLLGFMGMSDSSHGMWVNSWQMMGKGNVQRRRGGESPTELACLLTTWRCWVLAWLFITKFYLSQCNLLAPPTEDFPSHTIDEA